MEIVVGLELKKVVFWCVYVVFVVFGIVSLELVLFGVLMVVGYKVDWFFWRLKEFNCIFKFFSL